MNNNKIYLNLLQLKMKEGTTIKDHIDHFNHLLNQLPSTSSNNNNEWLPFILIHSLTPYWMNEAMNNNNNIVIESVQGVSDALIALEVKEKEKDKDKDKGKGEEEEEDEGEREKVAYKGKLKNI